MVNSGNTPYSKAVISKQALCTLWLHESLISSGKSLSNSDLQITQSVQSTMIYSIISTSSFGYGS
jgi:hypothetical protein